MASDVGLSNRVQPGVGTGIQKCKQSAKATCRNLKRHVACPARLDIALARVGVEVHINLGVCLLLNLVHLRLQQEYNSCIGERVHGGIGFWGSRK